MSDFTFQVVGDATKADKAIDGAVAKLETIPPAAKRAGGSITTAMDAAAKAVDRHNAMLSREKQLLEQIHGPAQRAAQDFEILTKLHNEGKISGEQYIKTLQKMGHEFGQTAEQAAKLKAQQTGQAMSTIGLPSAPTSAGGIMGGINSAGGALAAGAVATGVVGGVKMLAEIDDKYTNLKNSAMKFADAGHSVNDILGEQRELAHDLHSGMEQTIGAYDAVRDATDGLNLTHAEQIRLTKTLGEAAQMGGSSMESAAQAMQSLSIAFETGQDPARALRGIFKQFPDLTEQMTSAFGMSKMELLDMASSGQLSFEDLVRSMTRATDSIDQKFGQRAKTWSQTWHELTDAIERPISVDQLLAPFGTLDQSINRVAADVAALTRRWEELEQRARGPMGSYTATRLDTPADVAKRFATERIDAVQGARRDLAGLNQAYREGWLTLDLYRQKKEALLAIINGTVASLHKEKEAELDLAAIIRQRLHDEETSQDAYDRRLLRNLGESGDKQQAENETEWLNSQSGMTGAESDVQQRANDLMREQKDVMIKWQDEQAKAAEEAAQRYREAWAGAAGAVTGSLLKMAFDTKTSTEQMAEEILRKLAVIAVQQAALRIGGTGGAFLGGLGGSLLGGANGFDYLGNNAARQLPGFAYGGDMLMGGSGGTDSKIAMWRMTPGESLHVRTPEQRRQAQQAAPAAGGDVTVVNQYQDDPRALRESMSDRAGRRVIYNQMRRLR